MNKNDSLHALYLINLVIITETMILILLLEIKIFYMYGEALLTTNKIDEGNPNPPSKKGIKMYKNIKRYQKYKK